MNDNHKQPRFTSPLLAFVGVLALACSALAYPPPAFEVDWFTIDGGGNLSTSIDGYEIEGTIGQPDAGAPLTSLDGFRIDDGYWIPGLNPPCPQDFNNDGEVNPDDLGDYITCYFTEPPCPGADFNGDNDINPDDLGDFITTYFGPPCL